MKSRYLREEREENNERADGAGKDNALHAWELRALDARVQRRVVLGVLVLALIEPRQRQVY